MTGETTRFAPSPTGHLHLGHAYAAIQAAFLAKRTGGTFHVRLEDTDRGRCRPEFESGIFDDLNWLGLDYARPVRKQSEHFSDYTNALEKIQQIGCAYPCFCTRKDIEAEFVASLGAPQGPDGPIYTGTCRQLSIAERSVRISRGESHAWRMDANAAIRIVGKDFGFHEDGRGPAGEHGFIVASPDLFGDFILARKDAPASYHLAVVVDDDLQGITTVTRGNDLFASTHAHRLLQALLGLREPRYRHHALVRDAQGTRLAKRDQAASLRQMRAQGVTVGEIYEMLGVTSR
ncbi:MAG: tRNA glutamyl-Q(34) synthetase GluQRS [Micropepsaceae bacterium]